LKIRYWRYRPISEPFLKKNEVMLKNDNKGNEENFDKKTQDGGEIRVGRKSIFKSTLKKKWALLKSLCRPSVCPSVSYFSAAIAPRELKFST
jgi:hypothetical protein